MNSSLFVNSFTQPQITHTQAPAFKITCTTSILPWGQWQQLWQPPGTGRSGRGCWTCGQTDLRLQAGCSAMTSWAPGLGSAGCWWCRWQCSPPPHSLTTPVNAPKQQNPVFMQCYSSLKGSLRDAKSQNHFPTKTSGTCNNLEVWKNLCPKTFITCAIKPLCAVWHLDALLTVASKHTYVCGGEWNM